MIKPCMRYQVSTALHLLRRKEETQWWWEKVVQQVQTSIHVFHIRICQQCTHRGIVDIRYGWRVLAPEKHIATATNIACIVQIILGVHNLLSTTMTMQSVPISSIGRDPTTEIDTDDVSSVATPPIGYRNLSEDQEFVSKTIRFSFAPTDRSRIDSINPLEVHT
jgi:hypothetical protein